MTKILTKAQAKAVYDAMCALNNVGGNLIAVMRDKNGNIINVQGTYLGVTVTLNTGRIVSDGNAENYSYQAEFAKAYGVQ